MENKEKKKNQIWKWSVLILLVINLSATGGIIIYLAGNHAAVNSSTNTAADTCRYTMYIGTNDKDTYKQKVSLNEARDMVNAICTKYVGGYTTMEAVGGWVDETGNWTKENTLVYMFTDVKEEALKAIMDEVLVKLNQNSILLESSGVSSQYYYGK